MADIILSQTEQLPLSTQIRYQDMGDGTHALVSSSRVAFADSDSFDAFGRQRVSQPANRADVEFIYDKQPELIDEVASGGATATHNTNSRDVTLAIVNTTTNTSAALYSYDVPYTPGNSQLIEITGTLNNAGISGGTTSFFVRTSVTGSVVETDYPQSEWTNSLADLDLSKSQILQMDFQSLKVGRIRFAFVRNGIPTPAFEVFNDNIRATGYWQSPTLPFYWRIHNDATYTYMEMGYGDTANGIGLRYRINKNASATMRAICATVKCEGGLNLFDMPGFQRAASNGVTPITVSTTLIPILSIRPAALYKTLTNRGLYTPLAYSINGSNPIRFDILYRPVLTNPNWTAVGATYSGMEFDVSATAVTGGTVIESDYVPAAGASAVGRVGNLLGRTLLKLGRTGTSDILTIAAVRTGTSNSSTTSSFKWKELL